MRKNIKTCDYAKKPKRRWLKRYAVVIVDLLSREKRLVPVRHPNRKIKNGRFNLISKLNLSFHLSSQLFSGVSAERYSPAPARGVITQRQLHQLQRGA